MNRADELLLRAMEAALRDAQVDWAGPITEEEWTMLMHRAESHKLLPLVFQAVYRCEAAASMPAELESRCRGAAMQIVALQTRKTIGFYPVLEALRRAGVTPLVVKGITCRELYPRPDYRISSDEDILILPEQFDTCHRVLTGLGFSTGDPEDPAYELTYREKTGTMYLEIHRSLFPEENEAYGDLNRFFRDAAQRAVEQRGIPTLHPTDHVLYLILHAFKHFLHSGFGLRQVCDLILYANTYGQEIDWEYILDCCTRVRAEKFAAALFRIGWTYLGFSLKESRYPISWQAILVNEEELLQDILDSGIYGSAYRDRLHSSNITLGAVSARNQGKQSGTLLQSVFPSLEVMERKYPYLRSKPLLLPIAWTDRILRYSRSTANATDTVRIGTERVEMLKHYGILDK